MSRGLGRVFLPGESAPARTSAAIISHAIWRTQLGGADSVLGRTIRVKGEILEIVYPEPSPDSCGVSRRPTPGRWWPRPRF
jgi:hypothetical protein